MNMGNRTKNTCCPISIGGLLDMEPQYAQHLNEKIRAYCVNEQRSAEMMGKRTKKKKKKKKSNQSYSRLVRINQCYIENFNVTAYCLASCGEWNVILDPASKHDCFFWNRLSHQKIKLPKLHIKLKDYSKCILTAPPDEKLSEVFLFNRYDPYILNARVGYSSWDKFTYAEISKVFSQVVSCDGKIYATIGGSKLLYEFVSLPESYHLRVHYPTRDERIIIHPKKQHLVDSCDKLFLVQRFAPHKLDVYELDHLRDQWVRVNDLGSRVFLLSCYHSVSLDAKELGVQRNCIYFTEDDDIGRLYVFNLEDETLSISQHHLDLLGGPQMPVLRLADIPSCSDDDHQCKEVEDKEAMDVDGESNTLFQLLPMGVVAIIGTFVRSGSDYMNFRLVCRRWSWAAPPLQWLYDSEASVMPYPWLIHFETQKNDICNFLDPRDNITYHKHNIGHLAADWVIRFSKEGWLLFSEGDRSLFLMDQFTKRILQLPDLQLENLRGISFSGSPESSDFLVLGISYVAPDSSRIFFLRPTSTLWYMITCEFISSQMCPIFLNGSFYFLGEDGSLGNVTILPDNTYRWAVLNKLQKIEFLTRVSRCFLVSGNKDQLLSIFVGHGSRWVQVYQFCTSRQRWEMLDSLSGRTLFVSEKTSLVLEAEESTETMKNKIYFPCSTESNGCKIWYYCTETGRCGSNEDGEQHLVEDFYDAKQQLNCTWFRHRLTDTRIR